MSEIQTEPGGLHYCSACGQRHGGDDMGAAVKIAKIEADARVRIAEIERGETLRAMETAAETAIVVTELETAAGVEEAAALADGIADSGSEAEPLVISDVPAPDIDQDVSATIEPREDDDGAPPAAERKTSLSYWP